jgi:hypothetical protein
MSVGAPEQNSADQSASAVSKLLAAVMVLTVAATFLGLVIVQRFGNTYRDGLRITRDSAAVAEVSIDTAAKLAGDVARVAGTAADGLEQARVLVLLAAESTDDVGLALGGNVADGVVGTANIANGLAGLIETIENFIPGDSESLAEDLRALADGLEPVPDQLRALGEQLVAISAELDVAAGSLTSIASQLDALAVSVDSSRLAMDELTQLSKDIEISVDDALSRSRTDLWLMRIAVVLIGGLVVAAAYVARRLATSAGGGTRTHTPSGTGT